MLTSVVSPEEIQKQNAPKIALVVINLGEPEAPTNAASRRFLKQLLADARLVKASRLTRWAASNFFALFFRAMKLSKRYAAIWRREGSPLLTHTQKLTKKLARQLASREHDVEVTYAMRYGKESIKQTLDRLIAEGYERILILPLYPQYCDATTGSAMDAVATTLVGQANAPELRLVRGYHEHEGYISALAELVRTYWEMYGRPGKLLMSFRGIQKDHAGSGETYISHCQQTASLLAARLGLTEEQFEVGFQSGVGPGELKEPHTATALARLAKQVPERVDVVFPGLVTDCLDTLVEVDIEARQKYLAAGGQDLRVISCLNDTETWARALADISEQHLLGWPTMQNRSELGELRSKRFRQR